MLAPLPVKKQTLYEGFTLLELMIVVAIIGITGTQATPGSWTPGDTATITSPNYISLLATTTITY